MSTSEALEEKIRDVEDQLAVISTAIAAVRKSLLHMRRIDKQHSTTRFVNPALERKAAKTP